MNLFRKPMAWAALFCSALAFFALSGQTSAAEPVALSEVASSYGLTVNRSWDSDRVELAGNGLSLSLVPGIAQVVFNGHFYALRNTPVYRNGQLVLPPEVLKLLPAPQAPEPERQAVSSDKVVILDPGHGGEDPGAIANGVREKDVNLTVSLMVRALLVRQGVKVVMTRTNDSFPSLTQRADLANRTPNSIFISIHSNASTNRSLRGIETYILSDDISDSYRSSNAAAKFRIRYESDDYSGGNRFAIDRICREARSDSVGLARSIHGNLVRASNDTDRGVRRKNLHVLRESYFSPAILLELGYLSDRYSARRLASTSFQQAQARAIADGILQYLARDPSSAPRSYTAMAGSPRMTSYWAF